MWVCICHGIRCRDVKEVAGSGACRAGDVFRHFQVKPQCGRCLPTIRTLLQADRGDGGPARARKVALSSSYPVEG